MLSGGYVCLCQFLTQPAPNARKEFQQFGENHSGVKDGCGLHALKPAADKSQHYRLGFQGLQILPSYLKTNEYLVFFKYCLYANQNLTEVLSFHSS